MSCGETWHQGTGISKPTAIDPKVRRFTGSARVFDSDALAVEAIMDGKIVSGDVVVIRYEGPKGGPGMVEMYRAHEVPQWIGTGDFYRSYH